MTQPRRPMIQAQAEGSIGRPIPGQGFVNSISEKAAAVVQRTTQTEINAILQRAVADDAIAKEALEAEHVAVAAAQYRYSALKEMRSPLEAPTSR